MYLVFFSMLVLQYLHNTSGNVAALQFLHSTLIYVATVVAGTASVTAVHGKCHKILGVLH
jgi:hypothetical protein